MPNDTKDEIDSLTREITEGERTVAAAASIVNKKTGPAAAPAADAGTIDEALGGVL